MCTGVATAVHRAEWRGACGQGPAGSRGIRHELMHHLIMMRKRRTGATLTLGECLDESAEGNAEGAQITLLLDSGVHTVAVLGAIMNC